MPGPVVAHHDLLPVPDLQVGPARQRPQLPLDLGRVALALRHHLGDHLLLGCSLLVFLGHFCNYSTEKGTESAQLVSIGRNSQY